MDHRHLTTLSTRLAALLAAVLPSLYEHWRQAQVSDELAALAYQFRPLLKLIQADRPRLLVGAEVGVSKTIEAELILKELQARHEWRTVLVICSKPLVAKRTWSGCSKGSTLSHP